MRIRSLLVSFVLLFLVLGLMPGLSGCSGGSSQPSSVPSSNPTPVAADTTKPAEVADKPVATTVEPAVEAVADIEAIIELVVEELAEQPVLSWARDEGGLNHCDRLSIYADGRVEAIVCRATASEPMVHGNLTEEQLVQALAWAAEYSPFTRREMEMSRAVRTTMLQGIGEIVPALEAKVEIAAFAAAIFLTLTAPK